MSDWKKLCALDEIPQQGSRVVKSAKGDIAVFRTATDEIFALHDKCPHKGGPLSQGIVAGKVVTCPMHAGRSSSRTARPLPRQGLSKSFAVKLEGGEVWLKLG